MPSRRTSRLETEGLQAPLNGGATMTGLDARSISDT